MDKPRGNLKALPAPEIESVKYEVGYCKPPEATRFKPGKSGNLKGRPKGSKNAIPSLSDERIKKLIIEEAYRTVPIVKKRPSRLHPDDHGCTSGRCHECGEGQQSRSHVVYHSGQ
jgi:Family of unknown function (DUF5681)